MTDKEYCIQETNKHREQVADLIANVFTELTMRIMQHDRSKLEPPELDIFAEYTPKLKNTTYGSDEYKTFLQEMKPALDHHYAENRHHPEHFKGGIQEMNLIDLMEMLCDWKAATMRHADGDILRSIELNKKRFGYSEELAQIFRNTIQCLENIV